MRFDDPIEKGSHDGIAHEHAAADIGESAGMEVARLVMIRRP